MLNSSCFFKSVYSKSFIMKREIHKALSTLISDTQDNDVIIIEGARQVGKSYLVNDVLKEIERPHLAFDLEKNAKIRREISKTEDFFDFEALMTDRYNLKPGSILFFDEAQECSRLAEYVKLFKEDWKEIKVILTGSSMTRFFPKTVRIPVGRTKSMRVFSFSFSEFVRYIKGDRLSDYILSAPEKVPISRHTLLLELFDDYIVTGGYPEAVKALKDGKPTRPIIEEIMASLEEDFERKEAYQPGLFENTIRAVANHLGSPSKYTHIDTTKYYAKQIINAMKSWHIIIEVPQYSHDPNRSDFLPKRYLHDIGVANLFRTLSIPPISLLHTVDPILRTPLGGIFENATLLNLLSGTSASRTVATWKKGKQANIEVDFTVDAEDGKTKIPVECKATEKIQKRHYKNILHYLNLTGQNFGILVSAAPYLKINSEPGKVILNLPVYLATNLNIMKYFKKYA